MVPGKKKAGNNFFLTWLGLEILVWMNVWHGNKLISKKSYILIELFQGILNTITWKNNKSFTEALCDNCFTNCFDFVGIWLEYLKIANLLLYTAFGHL